jgi:hypothetical protein
VAKVGRRQSLDVLASCRDTLANAPLFDCRAKDKAFEQQLTSFVPHGLTLGPNVPFNVPDVSAAHTGILGWCIEQTAHRGEPDPFAKRVQETLPPETSASDAIDDLSARPKTRTGGSSLVALSGWSG